MTESHHSAALITVEGGDGAGKTTQIDFIESWLRQQGIEVERTREPGGTALGERLRQIMLSANDLPIDRRSELLMMFAARQQHLRERIIPALEQEKWVLSDRFVDASYAYQGGGRGVALEDIRRLENWVLQGMEPDLTILLDVDVETGVARSNDRGIEVDRFEQQGLAFKKAVREQYLARARQFPGRIRVVDAAQSINGVRRELQKVLQTFIKGRQ